MFPVVEETIRELDDTARCLIAARSPTAPHLWVEAS
jgi:hypothetical protein